MGKAMEDYIKEWEEHQKERATRIIRVPFRTRSNINIKELIAVLNCLPKDAAFEYAVTDHLHGEHNMFFTSMEFHRISDGTIPPTKMFIITKDEDGIITAKIEDSK